MGEDSREFLVGGLYRPELLARRAERLSGDVVISLPVSWQVMGYLLAGTVISCIAFLFLATYSRVEITPGVIVPDKGVATIVATRSGVITSLNVNYGDHVNEGDVLLTITLQERLSNGMSAGEQIEGAMARQNASLALQLASAQEAARAEIAQLVSERKGLIAEISHIQAQISLQRELVASAESDLESARALGIRGFVTGRELKTREDTFLSRQQQLAELEQRHASRIAAERSSERRVETVAAQAKATSANLASLGAQLDQQVTTAKETRSYSLRSPFAGKVTALTARMGRHATSDQTLLSIIPDGSTLQAELAVPSTAIGFIREGQQVRLAIDAFPYQRFGTLAGTVTTISESAVSSRILGGTEKAAYPVFVKLESSSIQAFGRKQTLVPDMTLSARIVTEKRTLIEWLFEPFFAVRQR